MNQFFFMILGLFLGCFVSYNYLDYNKKIMIKNKNNVSSIEKNVVKVENKEITIKKEFIEKLPDFIIEDLTAYDIKSQNLNEKSWNSFLEYIKNDNLKESFANLNFGKKSLLHLIVKDGSISSFKYLLSLGYDINAKDSAGKTPIFYAMKNSSDLGFIKFLVENGADINLNKFDLKKDDVLSEILNSNSSKNDFYKNEIIEYLKDNDFSFEKKHFKYLKKAANEKYLKEFVNNLDVNAIYNDKFQIGYAEYIIAKGSDASIDYMVENKLDYESYPNKKNIVQYSFNNPNTSLNSLNKLVEMGMEINQQNNRGYSPLMITTSNGDIDKINFLLEKGANLNLLTSEGKSIYEILEKSTKIDEQRKNEIKALLKKHDN